MIKKCIRKKHKNIEYYLTSAHREHDKNVSVFVRNMCITQRKIIEIFHLKFKEKSLDFTFCKGRQYFTRQKVSFWKDLHT